MSDQATNAGASTSSSTTQSSESLPIEQISIFSKLPSELTLEIFSYVDIVSLFRFLDTCRYHRFLLLNLPEIWRRVRFIPLSEYTTLATATSNIPHTSILAAANSPPASTEDQTSASSTSDFSKSTPKAVNRRLKHSENERDRDRGGSESLTSEIYAVLRRFRKSNRIVDFVREVTRDVLDMIEPAGQEGEISNTVLLSRFTTIGVHGRHGLDALSVPIGDDHQVPSAPGPVLALPPEPDQHCARDRPAQGHVAERIDCGAWTAVASLGYFPPVHDQRRRCPRLQTYPGLDFCS